MRILFFLFLLALSQIASAQTSNNALAFPSANNSFLGTTQSGTNIGVDLYTGTAMVSVPICTLTGRVFSVPVSVDYSAGRGVKVQDYASQVGLGWRLNAGGSVSRVVRGFPDEVPNGYLGTGTSPSGVLPAGQQWGKLVASFIQGASIPTNEYVAVTGWPTQSQLFGSIPTADGEPDIFYVKTPLFSFQFVFDANGNPVFSNGAGYKVITHNFVNTPSPTYQNSSFEVIDDQGNQFYFGSSSQSVEMSTDSLYNVSYTFPTTWYLDKMLAYNSKDTITLTYQASTGNDITYNYSWNEIENNLIQTKTTVSTGMNTITQPKYVSSIVSSTGMLLFHYVFNARLDDVNAPYLSSIESVANNLTLQTYTFNYGYFGSPSTDPNVLRLQLSNITVTGNTTATAGPLKIASFGYNTTANLPNRTWPVFDYWGYCNGTSNATGDLTTISRAPNATLTQADILNSLTTLEGATYSIFYEGNIGAGSAVGGLRVNKIAETLPTGESLYKTYQYLDPSGNPSGQVFSSLYSQLSFQFFDQSSNYLSTLYLSGSPYLLGDINGTFTGYSYVKEINQNGGYTYYNYTNFNDLPADADNIGSSDVLALTWSGSSFQFISSATSLAYKRGLLKSKGIYNAAGILLSQSTYTYAPQNTTVTYGGYGLRGMAFNGIYNNIGGESTCRVTYQTPVENYRLVKVTQSDYDQHTPADAVTSTVQYTYDPLNNRLVQGINTTDSKNQTHSQTIYHTEDVANTGATAIPMLTTGETTALNTMIGANRTGAVVHTTDNRNGTIYQVHNSYAAAVNNNIYLGQTSTYASDPQNTTNTLIQQQSFVYDAATSNAISSTFQGGATTSTMYGYNRTLPVAKIVNASSVTSPTTSMSAFTNTLSNGTVTTSQAIPFTVGSAGNITVSLSWPTLPASGSSNSASVSYGISGPAGFSSFTSGNICISSDHSCSAYTNTVSSSFACVPGNYTITIYGTNNPQNNFSLFQVSYPGTNYASVFTNEFFYDNFEEDGNSTTPVPHTGRMCYSGNYTVAYTPPNSRKYLIQWWVYQGSWVFHQQAYTGPITLTGPVDDVRVFPADALMTTYSYSQQVGKTSEIDPSGKTIVYQFDGLNRLQTVLDQDGMVLKQYDYEYQSCAPAVDNTVQSQSFTRQGCPTGDAASSVTYTVAAGKYSACTLTAANQLATNDISLNGQNYANINGTCTPVPCTAPTTVTASATTTSLTISWNLPPGVGTNAYAVFVTNVATGVQVSGNYGVAMPETVSGLTANTQYKIVVQSLCTGNPQSTPIYVTTP